MVWVYIKSNKLMPLLFSKHAPKGKFKNLIYGVIVFDKAKAILFNLCLVYKAFDSR
ncbi:hypothetical protein CPS_4109 [Colwellia psychrerythraea 34H]|uniref:Uncharacterized protein n=1 Tax=Colwellia psychrerythraea (strain 34H / ATCC BAA-681) TaxID=167879 RepID=Q47WQ8_COLP3|nr:hypothetical protein CPS_4109 [Colwellia psychrerythraea 34H]